MRADHRHELKTNELADWLMHFPEWLKENRNSLIGTAAIIVVALAVYFWIYYYKNVASARTQTRLTNLVTQLPKQKADIARAASQQGDQSYLLIDLAKDLQDFAQSTSNREMSAVALIKRAETLRTELHYRSGEVSHDEMAKQLAQAQASYEQAMKKAEGVPALAATAQFGLGLCEEELGNIDKAKEIYKAVSENAAYDGTSAKAAAAYRLKTVDDYKGMVVFKPAPPPQPPAQASAPTIRINPSDPNQAPVVIPMQVHPTPAPAQAPAPVQVPGPAPAPAPAPSSSAPKTDNTPAPATPTPVPAPAPEPKSSTGG